MGTKSKVRTPAVAYTFRSTRDGRTVVRDSSSAKEIRLDAHMSRVFARVLDAARHRRHIEVVDEERDLTPNQAASLIGVSRPYLRAQMNAGRLAFHLVGTHHRIKRADLLAFDRRRKDMETALNDLATIGQQADD